METKSTPDQAAYPPPLDRLLGLGSLYTRGDEWRDYREMGIEPGHVPDLVRMAGDPALNQADEDDPRVYAPLHAWRALGQLAAPEAAAPLVQLLVQLPDDDFANEELPEVLGMIGAAAIGPAVGLLANPMIEEDPRIGAVQALHEIATRHPELRDRCVEVLTRQLQGWAKQSEGLNGFLVDALVELRAVEAAPLMQAAFEAGLADPSIRGDWEDVQVDLGLLEERLTPLPPPPWKARLQALRTPPPPREISPGERARKLRKAQKQADKRKRKK
jgi:HEAT repeat protein